jgi:hypothetical protein
LIDWLTAAVDSVRQRHAAKSPAGQFPAGTINAVLGVATRRAKALKNKINNEIQAMALEGTLGMHRKIQSQHVSITGSQVGAVHVFGGDLNGSILTLITSGKNGVADAIREFAAAIESSEHLPNKSEILENLAYVSEAASQTPGETKGGTVKGHMGKCQKRHRTCAPTHISRAESRRRAQGHGHRIHQTRHP